MMWRRDGWCAMHTSRSSNMSVNVEDTNTLTTWSRQQSTHQQWVVIEKRRLARRDGRRCNDLPCLAVDIRCEGDHTFWRCINVNPTLLHNSNWRREKVLLCQSHAIMERCYNGCTTCMIGKGVMTRRMTSPASLDVATWPAAPKPWPAAWGTIFGSVAVDDVCAVGVVVLDVAVAVLSLLCLRLCTYIQQTIAYQTLYCKVKCTRLIKYPWTHKYDLSSNVARKLLYHFLRWSLMKKHAISTNQNTYMGHSWIRMPRRRQSTSAHLNPLSHDDRFNISICNCRLHYWCTYYRHSRCVP